MTGVGAAGAGLFIGTAVKLGRPLAKKPAALVLIAACFVLVAVARVSLLDGRAGRPRRRACSPHGGAGCEPASSSRLYFALLSLVSVGGLPSVMPEMQRYVVDVKGWLTPADFIQAFAVGQAAPGPNVLIASLIGWKVAGLRAPSSRSAAMCFPAAVIAWWVAELWDRFKDSPWREAIQRAIAPIVVGMILSGGVVLATPGSPDWRLWLIAGLAAAGMLATKLNPLWFLGAGAVLGALLL